MVKKECNRCKKEKELNEDNFTLKGSIYTKICIPCLVIAKKKNNKRLEINVSCLVCKKELSIVSFNRHCKSKTHLNNLKGIIIKKKKEPIICIYKIYCKDNDITSKYIGKTTNLYERKSHHKIGCYNINRDTYNFKVYKFIRENGGWDNWDIEIIEECNEDNLDRLELYYYEKFKPNLNRVKPSYNFNNAVIYKISCKDENIKECYIGSTINFKVRKIAHKTSCNNRKNRKYNYKIYKFIRENGGLDNWNMIIIKKFKDCKSEKELKKYEQEVINNCEYPLLNDCNSYTKNKERNERIIETRKKYNEKQKENKVYCRYCNSEILRNNFKRHWNLEIHKQNVKNFEENLCILIKKMNI